MKDAARSDGAAAAKGEEDNQVRYLARNGLRVTTFAVETFGRLGQEAEVVLTELAAAVRRRNLSRGLPAGCPLRRWRARISGLVARGFARTLRAAARVQRESGLPAV